MMQIETSLGIIEIPIKAAFSDDLSIYFETEWYLTLSKLYKFNSLTIEHGWLKINLDDEFYGCPEYKIIEE